MRDDLVVPGEKEEQFIVNQETRVVTVPFTPLEERMAKEKPQLMPGLEKLKAALGEELFHRHISNVHNINMSGRAIMFVVATELDRTNIERDCLKAIIEAFAVDNVRVVTVS